MVRIVGAWLVFTTVQGVANDDCADSSLLQLTEPAQPMRFSMIETKHKLSLTSRAVMTLDTACKHHPGAQIDLYVQAGTSAGIDPSVVRALRKVGCSVTEQRYDPLTFFKGTPFEAFAAANMTRLLYGPYGATMITDLVRMAALWKNGGWYLDTDIVVLRPLTRLGNVAGFQNLQDGGQVNGAVLHLEKGSPFLLHLASFLPGCFNPANYISAGPELATVAWRSYQGNDFHVLSKRTFFPIPAGKFKKIVTESVTDEKAKRILKHS